MLAQKDDVINYVRETEDYSMFELSDFNRNVVRTNEMYRQAKEGIIAPIIVNEDMVIIDGQTRFLHSKEVGVPVKYVIEEGLDPKKDITRMNTNQKKWSLQNFIEAYANQGLNEYMRLIDLTNKRLVSNTNLITIAIDLPTGYRQGAEIVRSGQFAFYNYDKTVEYLYYYKEFRERTNTPKRSKIETALYQLFRLKIFDGERLIKKVLQAGMDEDIRVKTPSHTEALKMLIDVYNKKLNRKSSSFIDYYITSDGRLIINEELADWTKDAQENDLE